MDTKKLYQEKTNRFQAAMRRDTPDRIPIFPIIEQWANLVTGVGVVDSYTKGPMVLADCFKKLLKEVYVDALYGTGNLRPINLKNTVGSSLYVISDEGVMIKGGKGYTMEADEYPELIENPVNFIMNKILPRKFPVLTDAAKSTEIWHDGLHDMLDWITYNQKANAEIESATGTPIVCKGATYLAPDIVLDFLRDFVGIMGDLRRKPQEVLDACDALTPLLINGAKGSWPNPTDEGVVFMPLHLATYLKPKDFAKFYYPYMKQTAQQLSAMNYPIMYYCENDWSPYLDIMQDMPDCKMMGLFEKGDLKMIKEKLGNHFCFCGGMKISNLKSGSKQKCIENAKWCIDNLAPGGGYIFGVDINLCYRNDAKLENVIAVCDYVHEKGIY